MAKQTSIKALKRRAKKGKMVKAVKSATARSPRGVFQPTPRNGVALPVSSAGFTGITGHDNIMAHFAARRGAQKKAADSFTDSFTDNIDFTLVQEANFRSKYHNVAGKRFQVNIFVGGAVSATLAKKSGLNVGAVVQIWRGAKSTLIAQSNADLNNARLNYRNETRIAATDVVSQSISLLRLSAPEHSVLPSLAIALAYNNDGVNAAGIHSVWD